MGQVNESAALPRSSCIDLDETRLCELRQEGVGEKARASPRLAHARTDRQTVSARHLSRRHLILISVLTLFLSAFLSAPLCGFLPGLTCKRWADAGLRGRGGSSEVTSCTPRRLAAQRPASAHPRPGTIIHTDILQPLLYPFQPSESDWLHLTRSPWPADLAHPLLDCPEARELTDNPPFPHLFRLRSNGDPPIIQATAVSCFFACPRSGGVLSLVACFCGRRSGSELREEGGRAVLVGGDGRFRPPQREGISKTRL